MVIQFSIIMIAYYAYRFQNWQETHWYQASAIATVMIVFLLDVIRSAVLAIVELRKFEIRKRSKAGDFVVRKVQKADDRESLPALLRPKPKTKAKATPPVPRVAPKFNNMERPKFLPDVTGGPSPPGMPALRSGMTPPGGRSPGNRTPLGGRTPPKITMGMERSPTPPGSDIAAQLAAKRGGGATPPPMPGGPTPPGSFRGARPPSS